VDGWVVWRAESELLDMVPPWMCAVTVSAPGAEGRGLRGGGAEEGTAADLTLT